MHVRPARRMVKVRIIQEDREIIKLDVKKQTDIQKMRHIIQKKCLARISGDFTYLGRKVRSRETLEQLVFIPVCMICNKCLVDGTA